MYKIIAIIAILERTCYSQSKEYLFLIIKMQLNNWIII